MTTTSAHLKILVNRSTIWHWQRVGNLILFYYICAAVCGLSFFLLLWCLKSEVCRFRHNVVNLHSLFPEPPFLPLTCHKTQTLHQWFSAMCQWDPRVARFHYIKPLQWIFHWLVSILWLNMCKPVKSADGENKKTALLGPDSMWLKTTALPKAGVTVKILKKTWLYWERFPADACYK